MSPAHYHDALGIIGTTVADKYRVERVVGEGGFSVVYRAEHIIWKQPVAIKCFKALANVPPQVREELLQGFIQEGKIMTNLSSRTAAIVQARDVGMFTTPSGDQVPYMVLEWLEGAPLDQVLMDENQRGFPARSLPDVIQLLEPVATALDTVHALNIAHRDIKPPNLFIMGDPRSPNAFVKILDFGIAKVMAEHAQLQTALAKTGSEITAFTPNYGAPEQFSRSHGATGPWTDVFALALIMIELVRGGVPTLQGDDYLQLAVAARDPNVRPTPRSFGLAVTDGVEFVFRKALAVSPSERYPTAGAFWADLRRQVYPTEAPWISPAHTGNYSATSRPSLPGGGPTTPPVVGYATGTQMLLNATGRPDQTGAPMSTASSTAAPSRSGGGLVIAGLIGVAVLGGGAAGAYFFISQKASPSVADANTTSAPAPIASASAAATASTTCPEGMSYIPGGPFFMGSDAPDLKLANPAHKVRVSPYCMDIHEVTAGDYKKCSDSGECKRAPSAPDFPKKESATEDQHKKVLEAYGEFCNFDKPDRDKHPMNCVTWPLADAYCKVQKKRLPTEAEWEFAARGSDGREYPWGNDEGRDKWHMNAGGPEFAEWEKKKGFEPAPSMYETGDGFVGTAPVGSFPKGRTQFGLDDMVGNVYEWTSDWFTTYAPDEVTDPTGAPDGDKKAIRGGAFNGGFPQWLKPAFRYHMLATSSSHGIGFRCVKPMQ